MTQYTVRRSNSKAFLSRDPSAELPLNLRDKIDDFVKFLARNHKEPDQVWALEDRVQGMSVLHGFASDVELKAPRILCRERGRLSAERLPMAGDLRFSFSVVPVAGRRLHSMLVTKMPTSQPSLLLI